VVTKTPPSQTWPPHHNAGKVDAALDEVAQRNREECSSSVTTTFHQPRATLHLAHLAIPGPSGQRGDGAQASPTIRSIIAVSHGPLQIELIG
jgi:hypothetical protein